MSDLKGSEHTRFINAHGVKEEQNPDDPQKLAVLLINYTLGMEMDALIPVLLYKHTADIKTQQFWMKGSDEKERKKGRGRAKEITNPDSKAKHPNFIYSKTSECCLPLEI